MPRISNAVFFMGRLTRDIELRTVGDTYTCTFSLAKDREMASSDGERKTDFIDCVAWGKTAEFISKYFSKGSKIGVAGHLQTRMYTSREGSNVKATEIYVESVDFVERKADSAEIQVQEHGSETRSTKRPAEKTRVEKPRAVETSAPDDFDNDDDDLPF